MLNSKTAIPFFQIISLFAHYESFLDHRLGFASCWAALWSWWCLITIEPACNLCFNPLYDDRDFLLLPEIRHQGIVHAHQGKFHPRPREETPQLPRLVYLAVLAIANFKSIYPTSFLFYSFSFANSSSTLHTLDSHSLTIYHLYITHHQPIIIMDFVKNAMSNASGNAQGEGNSQQNQSKEQGGESGGGGGGFLSGIGNKLNTAAGGGRESEKDEDLLDKGLFLLSHFPTRSNFPFTK